MATYNDIIPNTIKFTIGNGGAGITGFVQYMAQKFLDDTGAKYSIAWVTSDTEETLNGLAAGTLDVGWPYAIERVCEAYGQNPGWSQPYYIFRDHFCLVGPTTNPAGLQESADAHPHFNNDAVLEMFATIAKGESGVYFLTRDDLSATNVLERSLFEQATGKAPDTATDKWYVKLESENHYPDEALAVSNEKKYYTLTDRGIWTWSAAKNKSNLKIFCEAGDTNADDILLNPCLALTKGAGAPAEAHAFVNWLANEGQKYVEEYHLNGDRLYSKAPGPNMTPCS